MILSITAGIPIKAIYFYLPVLILSATIAVMMVKKKFEDPKILEIMCGLNIAVNLGTTMTYIFAYM